MSRGAGARPRITVCFVLAFASLAALTLAATAGGHYVNAQAASAGQESGSAPFSAARNAAAPGGPGAATPTPTCQPGTSQITIQSFAFAPQNQTIYTGQSINWTNLDPFTHTTTSDVGLWNSGNLGPNQSFSFLFDTAGSYTYHCAIHLFMTATITVLTGCAPAPTQSPTTTSTNTPTATDTPTFTATPTITATSTATPSNTPAPTNVIVGHVTWQTISQPNTRNVGITGTLTLCVAGLPQDYIFTTDASGFFTVTTGLPNGTYNWRDKGRKWLANSGTLNLSGGTLAQEFGSQRSGDSNNSNSMNVTDFSILKSTFSKALGDTGYDERADFTNDNAVNVADFNAQKSNFGISGAAVNCP